jgi:hypothetical protein
VLLAIETEKGMWCCGLLASGLKNMLDVVKESFPKPILAILEEPSRGASAESLTIARLSGLDIRGRPGVVTLHGQDCRDRIAASPLRSSQWNGTHADVRLIRA